MFKVAFIEGSVRFLGFWAEAGGFGTLTLSGRERRVQAGPRVDAAALEREVDRP
jgi:hypothetical protein